MQCSSSNARSGRHSKRNSSRVARSDGSHRDTSLTLPADFEFLNAHPLQSSIIQPTVLLAPHQCTSTLGKRNKTPCSSPFPVAKKTKDFRRAYKQKSPWRSSSTAKGSSALAKHDSGDDMMCWCCEVVMMRTGDDAMWWSCEVVKIWVVMWTCEGVGGDVKWTHGKLSALTRSFSSKLRLTQPWPRTPCLCRRLRRHSLQGRLLASTLFYSNICSRLLRKV